MNKALHIAWREFCATALTKGFIVGILLPPVMIGLLLFLLPLLMNQRPPATEGRIAIIDQSGVVKPFLETEFSPERLIEKKKDAKKEMKETAEKIAPIVSAAGPGAATNIDRSMALVEAMTPQNHLTLDHLDVTSDVTAAKELISKALNRQSLEGTNPRLALVVIPHDSVFSAAQTPATEPPSKQSPPIYANFDLYTAPTLDVEVKDDIEKAVQTAIVNSRIQTTGSDVSTIRAILRLPDANVKTVTVEGDRADNDAMVRIIPVGFFLLLWISVFTAGQSLLTSTVEEKASRVMEVLLSAASPMQLMVGKILGQMGVGMVIMLLYGAAGIAGLIAFAMNHLINPINLVYLAIYFIIAFFIIACMMAAIGSAVSEIREAQTLMMPIMLVMFVPLMLWLPIVRNPNSTFAQVCSFIPPITPFVMVLRISGSEPVPFWQIPATIAVGAISVVVAAWMAAKIFRIGVLMYGKPPNLKTLITWIRMA